MELQFVLIRQNDISVYGEQQRDLCVLNFQHTFGGGICHKREVFEFIDSRLASHLHL